MKRVAVVGGGISGLATALAIRDRAAREKRDVEVVVLEKDSRAGGKIRTETLSGYICEWGPNGFLDNVPETLDLVRRLKLEDHLQVSDASAKTRFLYRRGRLHPAPASFGAFLRSGLLSLGGKLRLMAEPMIPPRRVPGADADGAPDGAPAPENDESIRAFAARRIGPEGADVLVDSLVSGIFAGDPSRLSLRACFPKMFQMESEHGGLVRAMLAGRKSKKQGKGLDTLRPVPGSADPASTDHAASGSRDSGPTSPSPGASGQGGGMGMPAGTLTSFRGGIEELVLGLARELGPAVHTGTSVVALEPRRGGSGWSLVRDDAATLEADAVVLAGSASASGRLLDRLDPPLARLLSEITFSSVAVVCLGFDRASLDAPLDGFGFLAPRGEGLRILGALWDSSIYPGRAPEGKALIRAMIGGARDPEAVDLADAALLEIVRADLRTAMGLSRAPSFVHVFRHPQGIPQYTIGHLDRVRRIEEGARRHPGVFLAGNSYHGIAINSCVAEAPRIAQRVLAFVAAERSGPLQPAANRRA